MTYGLTDPKPLPIDHPAVTAGLAALTPGKLSAPSGARGIVHAVLNAALSSLTATIRAETFREVSAQCARAAAARVRADGYATLSVVVAHEIESLLCRLAVDAECSIVSKDCPDTNEHICPDCAINEHSDCVGGAWCTHRDEPAVCECAFSQHQPR